MGTLAPLVVELIQGFSWSGKATAPRRSSSTAYDFRSAFDVHREVLRLKFVGSVR